MKPISQITPQEIIDFLKKVDKKTWVKIGAAAFVTILFLVFVAGPAWLERPRVRAQIKATQGQIIMTQALFLKKPLLVKNKEAYSKLIAESRARLYDPGESSLLLGAISKLAIQSKVSVVASMPKESPAKFPSPFDLAYEGNHYDFTVEGSYHNLGDFISKIEASAKLLRVENFMVKARKEAKDDKAGPESPLAEVSLSAVSFKSAQAAK